MKTLGHSWGTVGAQLGHKVTWGTVEAKAVGAQLRHSWGTVVAQNRKLSSTVGAQLGHKVTWGTVGAQLGHS